MATRTRPRRDARRRLAAALAAFAMHVALGSALLVSVRRLVLPPEPPPLEVELVRPAPRDVERTQSVAPAPPPAPLPQLRPPRPSTLIPHEAPAPGFATPVSRPPLAALPAAGPSRAPAAPAAPPAPIDDPAGRVRDALRTSVGCDDDPLIGLSPQERAACARRRAQAARQARRPPPTARERAFTGQPERRDAHQELRPDWDCAAGGSLSCRGSAVMVGGSIPFGHVPKALPPIPPSTLYGDDRVRKKPEPQNP